MDFLVNCFVHEFIEEFKYSINLFESSEIDINKLTDKDYIKLKKSKNLSYMTKAFQDYLIKNNIYDFDSKVLNTLIDSDYNFESFKNILDYFNKYDEVYLKEFKRLEDVVKDIIDTNLKKEGLIGSYPLYIRLFDNKMIIERKILTLNSKQILSMHLKDLSFKVTTMEYKIPLNNYCFENTDLRGLSKDDIFKEIGDKVKIDLRYADYTETLPIFLGLNDKGIIIPDKSVIEELLESKKSSIKGMNSVIKDSLKKTGITILIFVVITILLIMFELFK